MRQFAAVLFIFLSFFASPSFSKTIYVNNVAGSDTNTGATPEIEGERTGPLRTIAAALRLTFRGDKIELANTEVPYSECITLQGARNSGFEFAPFVIIGNGATLDGTAPVPANKWEFVEGDLHRFLPEHGGHQMLFLDGQPAKELPRFDGSYVTTFLQPKEWCRCRGGIHFKTEKGKSPYAYDLRYAKHRVGITLYDVDHVVIEDLIVRGFQLDGINAHDNAMNCALYKVTAEANGRAGIAINGASRVKVVECVAHENATVQLRLDNWSTTHVIDSKLEAESSPVWTRHVNQQGQGARLFVDGERQYEMHGWWAKPANEQPQSETDEPSQPQGDELPAGDAQPTGQRDDEDAAMPGGDFADELDKEAADQPEDEPTLLDDEAPVDQPADDDDSFDLFDDANEDGFGDMEEDDPFGDF